MIEIVRKNKTLTISFDEGIAGEELPELLRNSRGVLIVEPEGAVKKVTLFTNFERNPITKEIIVQTAFAYVQPDTFDLIGNVTPKPSMIWQSEDYERMYAISQNGEEQNKRIINAMLEKMEYEYAFNLMTLELIEDEADSLAMRMYVKELQNQQKANNLLQLAIANPTELNITNAQNAINLVGDETIKSALQSQLPLIN